MNIARITTPKSIPKTKNETLASPVAVKDNLNMIVDIMKPVFLISWEYLSVYLKDINKSSTSTRINIVKKSTKNRKLTSKKERQKCKKYIDNHNLLKKIIKSITIKN